MRGWGRQAQTGLEYPVSVGEQGCAHRHSGRVQGGSVRTAAQQWEQGHCSS